MGRRSSNSGSSLVKPTHFRKGMTICETDGSNRKTYKSINEAKKASRQLQSKGGLGCVRLAEKLPKAPQAEAA